MYKKNLFENKSHKRNIERTIVDIFKSKKVSGNYIGLTGPTPRTHYENWSRLLGVKNVFNICEIDKEVYKIQQDDIKTAEKHHKITLNLKDIFKFAMEYNKKIGVLDLDLCKGLSTLEDNILETLENIFRKKGFRQEGAGITICYTPRREKSSYIKTQNIIRDIKRMAIENQYRVRYCSEEHYKEGQSMIELAFIVSRDANDRW